LVKLSLLPKTLMYNENSIVMNIPLYGFSRTHFGGHHAFIAPESLVSSQVPSLEAAEVKVPIAPEMGARFAQFLITFKQRQGQARFLHGEFEHFAYVAEGSGLLEAAGRQRALQTGSYFYVPPRHNWSLTEMQAESRLILFKRRYAALEGVTSPEMIVGHLDSVPSQPYLGDPRALLQTMLPDKLAFDMGIHHFTFQPGASLPHVKCHVMEHGILMVRGQGIFRLENSWYPARIGDVIWTAPYCPFWFAAIGHEPAAFLSYQGANREPAI
jgi:(S)-ureidoglycine aminohydrolase